MDLRQLANFVGVAESGSMTRASDKVWRSQSALSRQIQDLETELGVVLFERQARGVQLTDAGRYVLERSRSLLKEAESLRLSAAAMGVEPTGTLTLGAPPSLGPMLVASFTGPFLQRYPKVRLQLKEGTSRDIRDALGRGELDLAIVSSQEPLDTFRQFPLIKESLFLVGPPQAGLKADRYVPISALKKKPLLLTPYPNSLRQIVDTALAKAGAAREPIIEADMVSMMLDLVQRGLGYTVLAYCAVHDGLSARRVCASPVRGLSIEWIVCQSKERPENAAIKVAREALFATASHRLASGIWATARPLFQGPQVPCEKSDVIRPAR